MVGELISDESARRDRIDKLAEYGAAGVPEYWLFDPRPRQHRAEFYRLGAEGRYEAVLADAEGRYHSLVLPGFWLKPDWLWQDPLPKPAALLAMIAPPIQRDVSPSLADPGRSDGR